MKVTLTATGYDRYTIDHVESIRLVKIEGYAHIKQIKVDADIEFFTFSIKCFANSEVNHRVRALVLDSLCSFV